MQDYAAFLESKRLVAPAVGFEVDPADLHPKLFPHQRAITAWALRRGRAAVFAGTGLGKTIIQLVWGQRVCEHTRRPVLILAPLGVVRQTAAEGERFGIPVTVCRSQADVQPGINIANYDILHHFDTAVFGGVVLDECFAKGTMIDTPSGPKPIEECIIGEQILNAAGVDTISDVHRREVPHAIRITVGGRTIVSSPNHPYFTQRGWVGAQDILPGDGILATAEAVRMVRDAVSPYLQAASEAVLRAVLLSELADDPTGDQGQGTQPGSCDEARRQEAGVVRRGVTGSRGGARAHPVAESHEQPRHAGEGLPPVEGHEAQTFRAWGQRNWFDQASTDLAGCARFDMGGGIQFVVGPTDSRLSVELQARLSRTRAANQYRSGWSLAPQPEGRGPEAGCEGPFAGVDGLEVLEPGHPGLEQFRDADGKLYFYDLGATRHPSFSVNGLLVHNSSILKAFAGATKKALIAAFRETPFRLCCTATPAPNDTAELCNHADFLSVMSPKDMITIFFTAKGDTGDSRFRLKAHARTAFFEWMASWAMSLTRPSDLGYPDDGYLLPPLQINPLIIPTGWRPADQLVFTGLKGVTQRAAVRRDTLSARVDAAAEVVRAEPGEQWLIWRKLLDEGRALAKELPGAVHVEGKDAPEHKAEMLAAFAAGQIPWLITDPAIAAFGMNFQLCARELFVGLSDSYEQYFQGIRRCWRFGQTRPVRAWIVLSDAEEAVYENVLRKEREHEDTMRELLAAIEDAERREIRNVRRREDYLPTVDMVLPDWLRSVEAPEEMAV